MKTKKQLYIAIVIVLLAGMFAGLKIKKLLFQNEEANVSSPKEMVFYTWKDYTDKSVLKDFQKQFGIKVILKEYETRDMMISEIQSEPANFDVIVAPDVVPALMQRKLLMKLDLSKIPNCKYIDNKFRNRIFDPQDSYSLPGILWGTTGIVINTDYVPADINSWSVFWDKKYKDKIALMDECRDAMTAVLKYSRFSLNTIAPNELEIAEQNAKLLRDNDVQFGETFENLEKVISGKLWISQAYGGDVIYKAKNNKNIKYILPIEGFNICLDNLVISCDSCHKEEAHQFINFLLEPKNAAKASKMFSYPSVVNTKEFIDSNFLNDPDIYPTEEVLRHGEFFNDVGDAENMYVRIFNMLKQK